ncbi:MAG: hypothetical protein ABSB59_31965 [Streptosporangiaceae bacterium]
MTVGVVIAVSGGGATTVAESALGTCASASASASAPAASASAPATAASAAPCPSASGAVAAAASPTATAAAATSPAAVLAAVTAAAANNNGPIAARQLGDVANAPVDGAGNAISLNQTAAQAAASGNCSITVPANPLSAKGLSTPWQLGDGCSMANAGTQGAFVEATILSPNGQLQVYNPLVITAGTTAAATPAAPTIARGSQVIIDVGFNGTNLALVGNGARQGACVDALGQSLIGQVSACNAVNFYRMANAEIARGTLQVTPVGTSTDGQACQTTRNFGMIDQDQSDNVITTYLLNGNGQTAQNTAANATALAGATTLANGSDNKLLAAFLDPATGCKPFEVTDTTDPTGMSDSQAINELQARVSTTTPVAVVPPADEMTLVGGAMNIAKTDVYRSLVDQPLLAANANAAQISADYCQNMVNIQPARNQLDMANELNATSPVPAVGNTLATFMGNRLSMSFTNLGCNNFGLTDPVTVTLDGNQVATAVTYNLTQQKATAQAAAAGGTGTANPPAKGHRKGHRFDNPSGM